MNKDLIDLLKEYYIIKERNGKYFSSCSMGEEITEEINEIKSKLK